MYRRYSGSRDITHPSRQIVLQRNLCPPVGEVCDHNPDIHKSSKNAGAEATDLGWGDFGEVHGADNDGLANTDTSDESSNVDGSQATVVAHEDTDTDEPKNAELSCSPDTAPFVADNESTARVMLVKAWGKGRSTGRDVCTYKRAPATLPSWTMDETVPFTLASSTLLRSAMPTWRWKALLRKTPLMRPY